MSLIVIAETPDGIRFAAALKSLHWSIDWLRGGDLFYAGIRVGVAQGFSHNMAESSLRTLLRTLIKSVERVCLADKDADIAAVIAELASAELELSKSAESEASHV